MCAASTVTAENRQQRQNKLESPAFDGTQTPQPLAADLLRKAGTNPNLCASLRPMTDNETPFARLSLERAIALRWMLRDIKAKRLRLSPVSQADLATLTELGLIEMREDMPVLTQAGHDTLDR
jgi:hypothetical protein